MYVKYHFFKNFTYALSGLVEVFKHETSFKIEVALFVLMSGALFFLNISLIAKAVMQAVLFVPLIVELINSSIERIVDKASPEHHILAKHSKDAAAGAVLISLVLVIFVWSFTLLYEFGVI